jgi:hypothetical protein
MQYAQPVLAIITGLLFLEHGRRFKNKGDTTRQTILWIAGSLMIAIHLAILFP